MKHTLICAFLAPIFIVAILTGDADRAIAEESGGPYQRQCDTCLKYCRGEPTCAAHCRVHDCQGRPYPGAVNAPASGAGATTGPTKRPPPTGNKQ
jgi:hypothetical protein